MKLDNQINSEILPLSITDISIKKFQSIKELNIGNIPYSTQWIFLTGENGYGKTVLLRAILSGLVGVEIHNKKDITEDTRISIEYQHNSIPEIKTLGDARYKPVRYTIAGYGSIRINLTNSPNEIEKTANLFDNNTELLNIEHKLIETHSIEELRPINEMIKKALYFLIPKLYRIEIVKNESGTGAKIDYYEKDDDGKELPPVDFKQLAMGIRGFIGLIGDMIIQLTTNKSYIIDDDVKFINKLESKPKSFNDFLSLIKEDIATDSLALWDYINERERCFNKLSDLIGIFLIDEFDNHLHPKWQRDFVKKLSDIFPKVQFIVSTHSPIPLLGAPPERTVILNVHRTKEEGITVRRLEKLEQELKYLTPNQLLTSDIFGLEEIENVYLEDNELDKVPIEDNYDDIEKNKKMMQELEELAKNKEVFPDDLFKNKNL